MPKIIQRQSNTSKEKFLNKNDDYEKYTYKKHIHHPQNQGQTQKAGTEHKNL